MKGRRDGSRKRTNLDLDQDFPVLEIHRALHLGHLENILEVGSGSLRDETREGRERREREEVSEWRRRGEDLIERLD